MILLLLLESAICVWSKCKDKRKKLKVVEVCGLVELPLQFLHRKSADRAVWTQSSLMEAEARP